MHDRYALGCWSTDAYVAKYNLPTTDCSSGVPDSSIFYTNENAIADVSKSSVVKQEVLSNTTLAFCVV